MKNALVSKLTSVGDSVLNTLSENSPKIFVMVGAAGTVVAGVLACRATVKAPSILEEHKSLMNDIHVAHATMEADEYSETDYRLDLVKAYSKVSWEFIKLYGPAIAIEMASLGSIFASNNILQKRNASLTAAYTTLDAMYNKYRKNVVETFGEDVDRDMRLGLKHKKTNVIEATEDGDNRMTKEVINVVDPDDIASNPYARFFGPGYSNEATKSPEYNMNFLLQRQDYWNMILHSRYEWRPNGKSKLGYVYLEEVLKDLDLLDEEEEMPHHVGWIYDEENPKKYGDGQILFRIIDTYGNTNERFVNRMEATALLDFNVDGVISDKVYRRKIKKDKINV